MRYAALAARGTGRIEADPPCEETIRVESRSDLKRDGFTDLAYIARSKDKRDLQVVIRYVSETDFGENPAQLEAVKS